MSTLEFVSGVQARSGSSAPQPAREIIRGMTDPPLLAGLSSVDVADRDWSASDSPGLTSLACGRSMKRARCRRRRCAGPSPCRAPWTSLLACPGTEYTQESTPLTRTCRVAENMTADQPSMTSARSEGGPKRPPDRRDKALAFVNLSGQGLEIGPSYSPLVAKASGAAIETIDHASRDALVGKFRAYGVPEEKLRLIEEVDHIWTGGSIVDAVGKPGHFDYVVAAHVVEHSVDLIAFLQDCERLIRDNGRVSLVVPDKRYCFDRLKPLTSVGGVVDAHVRPTRFHPPGPLLDHQAYACTMDGLIAWWSGSDGNVQLQDPNMSHGASVIADGLAQDEYRDVHRWVFTPSSFSLLMQDLRQLGYHSLVEVGGFETDGFEFFVTLAKADGQPPADRLQLMHKIELEQAMLWSPLGMDALVKDVHDARLRTAEQLLEEMRASTSWRVTRPLRALSRLVRRFPT